MKMKSIASVAAACVALLSLAGCGDSVARDVASQSDVFVLATAKRVTATKQAQLNFEEDVDNALRGDPALEEADADVAYLDSQRFEALVASGELATSNNAAFVSALTTRLLAATNSRWEQDERELRTLFDKTEAARQQRAALARVEDQLDEVHGDLAVLKSKQSVSEQLQEYQKFLSDSASAVKDATKPKKPQ